jgi:hypothetical protein
MHAAWNTRLCETGGNWVSWELADDSLVHCECKPVLERPFAADPQPLHKFLAYLESNRHVRTKVHMHNVKRRDDAPGRYEISSTEKAVMEVKMTDAATVAAKPTLQNFGNYVDVKSLKESQHVHIVHKLVFESATNKIICSFPAVFLKNSIRLNKGDVVKLAG